ASNLEANIRAAFKSGRVKTSVSKISVPYRGLFSRSKAISMEEFMVRVWKSWLPESSADHAGLCNIGPMYLNALIVLLSAARSHGALSRLGKFDQKMFGSLNGFEPHPIDLVRALLCIEAINHLRFSDGAAWGQALTDRLRLNQHGVLPVTVSWVNPQGIE